MTRSFIVSLIIITILFSMAAAREADSSAVVGVSRDARRGAVVFRAGILFDRYETALSDNSKIGLGKVADILVANDGFKVRVEGYTDTHGNARLNRRLSEERAASAGGRQREGDTGRRFFIEKNAVITLKQKVSNNDTA